MTSTLAALPPSAAGPHRSSPVVPDRLTQDPEAPRPVYADTVWSLSALGKAEGQRTVNITWRLPQEAQDKRDRPWPTAELRDGARAAAWALLNIAAPDEHGYHVRGERPPSQGTVATFVSNLRALAWWLADQGLQRFADADERLLNRWRGSDPSDSQIRSVERLWEYAPHLPEHARLPEPPWLADGFRARGRGDRRNENETEAVHPATMSPLLLWALRVVNDLSPDIVAAWREHQSLTRPVPPEDRDADADAAVIDSYLAGLADAGQPLPGYDAPGGRKIANRYIAGRLGIPWQRVGTRTSKCGLPVGNETPLDAKPTALLNGSPWRGTIHYSEVPELVLTLTTACLIVVAYLSGMRTSEVVSLRTGCCPEPTGEDRRYRIRGRYYKGARGPDGKPVRTGLPRDWVVVPPVRDAVRVMESLVGPEDGLTLFQASPEWWTRRGGDQDKAMQANIINKRIARFTEWANRLAAGHGLAAETVPADPNGAVTTRRLRRTVAWFVFRRPGGRIALGVQYGHLDLAVTDGYGNKMHSLDDVFEVERARVLVSSLQQAAEAADRGEHVSGPPAAVEHHRRAVRTFNDGYRGTAADDKTLKRLAANPTLQVTHNDDLLLSCNARRGAMLCQAGLPLTAKQTPDVLNCQPQCGCITRSDSDIALMRAQIADLHDRASSGLLPMPLADRLRSQAAGKQAIVDRHEQSRPAGATA